MNSFNGIGNIATDLELRKAPGQDGEQSVTNFLLAMNRPGQDAGADFIRVTVWGKQAESVCTYLSKGKKVGVTGRLKSGQYEKDGVTINTVEIVANRVEFLTPREDSENAGPQVEQAAAPEAAQPAAEAQAAAAAPSDDIPF